MAAVAVTGDVGAGKSTVAGLLEEMGGARFDADAVAGEVWRRPDVIGAASARWGEAVLNPSGDIVHSAVAARIFSDREEYAWCCGLLHPLVMTELERRVAALPPSRWAVVEIPMLFEAGRPAWVTSVVFVTAQREARVRRRREQRGWDEAELERREGFFLPSGERMRRSDLVVHNDGDLDSLRAAAGALVRALGMPAGES